jgi:hypothetical protein
MIPPTEQDYSKYMYSKYMLMDPRSQETQNLLDATKKARPVSGANRGEEESLYLRACAQAIKQVDNAVIRTVVVAHYDEDLSWMQALDPTLRKFVYSKGKNVAHENLPNIGREYHTYFTHIVRHYDALGDVTFFLQGWPLDRSAHVISGVNYLRHFDYIEFGSDILETGPVGDQLFNFLTFLFGPSDRRSCSRAPWEFRANTQFGASRDCIRRRLKEFYEMCLEVCEKGVPSLKISADTAPFLFEQVWALLFQPRL